MLQEALRRKRVGGRPDAFWGSLRIVFLHNSLLDAVNDEREAFHDSSVALRQRRQEATWARRSLRVFLKRSNSTRWGLYEYSYLPPVTGSLLEFGDQKRKKVAHLLVKRPRQPTADHLYLELAVIEEGYMSALFEDVIRDSEQARMIVPVGYLANKTFRCEGLRLHSSVLKDGSDATGWLPMILVVTSRRRGNQVEALLQLRTEQNSGRELNRLSHLGGHVQREDLLLPQRGFGGRRVVQSCRPDPATRCAAAGTGGDRRGAGAGAQADDSGRLSLPRQGAPVLLRLCTRTA